MTESSTNHTPSLKTDTGAAAAPHKAKPPRPQPFSLRLTDEERRYLQRKAGNKPLGTYIRSQLLDGTETRRNAVRAPSTDFALLAQVLGALGKSELASCLCILVAATEQERVRLDAQESAALLALQTDVSEMRRMLVSALGLKP